MTEMKNSSDFQQGMSCLGVTEKQKNDYLKQYEIDYRSCLSKHPQNIDDGKAFFACLTPKMVNLTKSLNVDESLFKKCTG